MSKPAINAPRTSYPDESAGMEVLMWSLRVSGHVNAKNIQNGA